MLYFFDYVYYRVYLAYARIKGTNPMYTAGLVVSGMQIFNIAIFFEILSIIKHEKIMPKKVFLITFLIILIIFNSIRYKVKHETFIQKWRLESKTSQTIYGVLTVSYIILSTAGFFGLAVYLGSKRW